MRLPVEAVRSALSGSLGRSALIGLSSLLLALFLLPQTSIASADSCSTSGSPAVSTDQDDYAADAVVEVTGTGMPCGEALLVSITRPDGSVITGDGTGTAGSDSVTTDASGEFAYSYALSGTNPDGSTYFGQEGVYTVDVVDGSGIVLATTTFTDSHFRFGHITWTRVSGRTVRFTVTHAWRDTACSSVRLFFGDGGSSFVSGPIVASGTDAAGFGYCIRRDTVDHTYASDGPFTAVFATCCRISGLVNASSASFRVSTEVDLRNGNQGSPVSSIPVVLQMAQGANVVPLPIADPDGDPITCRMASSSESAVPSVATAGTETLAVTSGCDLVWDASAAALSSRYAAQVMITENRAAGSNDVALDFIIEIVGSTPSNERPTCALSGSASNVVPVGQLFSISATGNDADGGNLTINHLGLPTGAVLSPPAGTSGSVPFTGTFTWTPGIGDTGTAQAVTIVFVDPFNLQATCAFSITIPANQPPTADAGGPYSVDEGSSVTLDASGSTDPDGASDIASYDWDLDNDGQFDDASGVTASFLGVDGPGVATVGVEVCDSAGACDTDTATVTVNNVAPTVTATGDTIDEAGTATVSGAISDPGSLDAFEVTIAWGDGSPNTVLALPAASTSYSATHTYVDDGPSPGNGTASDDYAVNVEVSDGDGGIGSASTTVTVNNVAPALDTLSITSPINENDSTTLTGDFTDPGTLDVHTLEIDWGDGNTQTVVLPLGSRSFSVAHQYLDDDPTGTPSDDYPVTVGLTDDDGGAASGAGGAGGSGGDIYLTGHDVLLHDGQNGYDSTILDYLRGPVPKGDYSIAVIGSNVGFWGWSDVPGFNDRGAKPGYESTTYWDAEDMTSADWVDALSKDVLVILSHTSCGGCDLATTGSDLINARAPDIAAAVNAGMDLWGLSGASLSTYYDFLPPGAVATGAPIGGSSGFTATTEGAAIGIVSSMINGFPTHNRFAGHAPAFTVMETRGSEIISLALRGARITDGGISTGLSVTVSNVAPTITASGDTIVEGGTATVSGTIFDPGTLDTFTVVIDWGEGLPQSYSYPAGSTSYSETHTYVDDNPSGTASDSYGVSVTVTDDDTGVGAAATSVTVNNVAPELTLDTTGSVILPSGLQAFLGRKDVAQTHDATATDIGPDDLTFDWNSGQDVETYPSGGVFPFSATDTGTVTYGAPGVTSVDVTVTDDDTGSDSDSLAKLITDDCDCTKSKGFWKKQTSEKRKGKNLIPLDTLGAYLDLVDAGSAVFGAMSVSQANGVLDPKPSKNGSKNGSGSGSNSKDATTSGSGSRKKEDKDSGSGSGSASGSSTGSGAKKLGKAKAQALAAWLNFAKGAIGWDELVDTDKDKVGDMTFGDIIAEVELILSNPSATDADLERAKDLAEAVNVHDKKNPDCDTGSASASKSGSGTGTGTGSKK